MRRLHFVRDLWRRVAKPQYAPVHLFVQQHDALLMDFAYSNLSGHHHALNQLFVESFETLGASLGVLANQSLEGPTADAVLPYFKRNVYGQLRTLAEWKRRKRKVELSLAGQLGELRLDRWAGRLVVAHTISSFHLLGLLRHWANQELELPLVLYLMLPPEFDLAPELWSTQEALYQEAFKLASVMAHPPTFVCENALLAATFGRLSGGAKIRQIALPARFPPLPTQRSACARPTMLYIGDARADKGIDLLIQCLSRPSVRRLPVTIRLLITAVSEERRAQLEALRGDNIALDFQAYLPTAQYFEAIAQADLMLLPYDPECYRIKNSNVLSEALGMGVPVLLPNGPNSLLDFASAHADGAWIAMEDYSVEGLSAALQAVVSGLQGMKAHAASAMPRIRHMRSVNRFAQEIQQCLSEARQP